MLSSFASIEQAKVMKFVKSFSAAVSILTGGLSLRRGKIVMPVKGLVDKNSELAIIFGQIEKLTHQLGLEKDVTVSSSERGPVMRLSDTVLFELGKAEILPEADPFLKKICAIIKKTTNDIRIEGHTDDLPIHPVDDTKTTIQY